MYILGDQVCSGTYVENASNGTDMRTRTYNASLQTAVATIPTIHAAAASTNAATLDRDSTTSPGFDLMLAVRTSHLTSNSSARLLKNNATLREATDDL